MRWIVNASLLIVFMLALSGCGNDKSEKNTTSTIHERPGVFTQRDELAGISPEMREQIVGSFNRGVALMDQFSPVEAVEAFEEVVRLSPDWATGRLNLGIALLNAQSDEYIARSEKELKWVIEKKPGNPYAHYALGMLLRHLTRFDEAKTEFESVLRIDPEDPDTHYQLGTLIMENDPETARRHLAKTLEKLPHHESACYRLATILRKTGEKEQAKDMLKRFRSLKATGAGVYTGMKYGEMGRYAEIIRAFGEPDVSPDHHTVPTYNDIAGKAGLSTVAAGTAGWPGIVRQGNASDFGPGIAAADIEGNGDLAIFITSGNGVLYQNKAGILTPVQNTGINGKNAIGAYFGDYDSDGDPDLYLTCAGPNRLYRNEGGTRFTDVTKTSGTAGDASLSICAAWADADHDGDLDIYVANFSSSDKPDAGGAPNVLWRNNGDGTFDEVAAQAGINGGAAATMAVLYFDFDGDLDLDLYLINWKSPNLLFLNDRIGRYSDATSRFPEISPDSAMCENCSKLWMTGSSSWREAKKSRWNSTAQRFQSCRRGGPAQSFCTATATARTWTFTPHFRTLSNLSLITR